VFDLESFYPEKDRFELAVALNNLLASPGFSIWMQGEPLDVGRLLYTPSGKPRLAVMSIAHLSDAERMFFVTLLLNAVTQWMRSQPGTNSLRAILYMDEIFGYFPPSAAPPSKAPMLTLLKQGRAYGLGVVLATQNPVDLDYKGLSNAGTWFLGRLQTERDKARVMDGLEGAAAGRTFDRQEMDKILSGLNSRVFMLHNVHEDEPVLFHTRWALSYLRGPLTRDQIKLLARERAAAAPPSPEPVAAVRPVEPVAPESEWPVLPAEIDQFFLPGPRSVPQGAGLLYRPALIGIARLHYARSSPQVDEWQTVTALVPLGADDPEPIWDETATSPGVAVTDSAARAGGRSGALPDKAFRERSYSGWRKDLITHLFRAERLVLWRCPGLKEVSRPGEDEGAFRARLGLAAREARDLTMAKLRRKYEPKLRTLEDRIRRAEARVERERAQYGHQKTQTAISVGATFLGALFGRKKVSASTIGRATTSMRGAGRAAREKGDIKRALKELEALQQRLADMERDLEGDLDAARSDLAPEALELAEVQIAPRKSDIVVERFGLAWVPWLLDSDGAVTPATGGAT
jgi:hypothetical protein